ncbi:MAG: hypothetical protein ACLPV4_05040 [Solirubrobacteraceae bacterium]
MGKVWILDTETKGTGANVVPLDRATKRSPDKRPLYVPPKPPTPVAEPTPSRSPNRFRIVDLMTRQTLADEVSAREAVDVLKTVRSIVDVNVYMWRDPPGRWQMLPFADRRALWDGAHARQPTGRSGSSEDDPDPPR